MIDEGETETELNRLAFLALCGLAGAVEHRLEQLLRSDDPISPEVRKKLADALSANGTRDGVRLTVSGRGVAHQLANSIRTRERDAYIGRWVVERRGGDGSRKSALSAAVEFFRADALDEKAIERAETYYKRMVAALADQRMPNVVNDEQNRKILERMYHSQQYNSETARRAAGKPKTTKTV